MKKILFFLLTVFTFSSAQSQTSDSLQVSLLTVAPHSRAVWTVFGHTALRLYDPVRKIDAVFNWGTFDFEQPNFILHFLEGKTDYFLSARNYESVMYEHTKEKASVTEQILNIPDCEKDSLLKSLLFNYLPENSEYRYNFIFDNCTTRPHNFIERFCGGTMMYPEQKQPITFRQLIHQCTHPYPWLEFGIDCIIGSGADSLISYRNELFLPEKLMDALNRSAVKLPDGSEQPLVLATEVILHSPDSKPEQSTFLNHPPTVSWIIFSFYLVLCITAYYKYYKKSNRLSPFAFYLLPFTLLFLVAGAGGCIVFMLNFFSLHPCVQANWNLLWLHPLHFIAVAGFFFRKSYRWIRWYHAANFVLLSCFLLGWHWIPQELNVAFIPFILCLWMVSGLQAVKFRK